MQMQRFEPLVLDLCHAWALPRNMRASKDSGCWLDLLDKENDVNEGFPI